jgi:hypothetical protein
MLFVRFALLWLVLATIVVGVVCCKTLALSGEKKYKVDLSNVLLNIKDEIDTNGVVSDKTYNKFADFLEKSEEEFGIRASHMLSKDALESIRQAKDDPNSKFQHYQNALMSIANVQDALKTEVKD